ncbi:hypothetical protein I551_6663 [Mycobacterium ulcerans str. Harvey]|uniref:Uncharacterized protein n=1 Tax=Mycobacterium ulcerans str. Harvey TaxID=1299332 RepID=A0ABP3A608_MYCUL|nr:hypothetical protein I551_6663 [Mycobacterium ulcerans str. Harvey]
MLLRRVTGTGVHPRLAVASWLSAVFAAIAAWVGALVSLGAAVLDSIWRHRALALCLKELALPANWACRAGSPRRLRWVCCRPERWPPSSCVGAWAGSCGASDPPVGCTRRPPERSEESATGPAWLWSRRHSPRPTA